MPDPVLRGVAVFDGVDDARLAALESASARRSLGAGEVVFRAGDECDGAYVVIEGAVMIRREVVGEPVERVRDLTAGDLFGEMEVLDGSRRLFSARTLGPATVLHVPLERLREVMARHPSIETKLRTLVIHRRTSRLRALLAPQSRHEERIRVDREVVLALPGGARHPARLEDLSHGGACLVGVPAGWHPGCSLLVTLGTAAQPDLLPIRAAVRWRRDTQVGLAFEVRPGDEPAHRRRIEQALAALLVRQ